MKLKSAKRSIVTLNPEEALPLLLPGVLLGLGRDRPGAVGHAWLHFTQGSPYQPDKDLRMSRASALKLIANHGLVFSHRGHWTEYWRRMSS